MFSIWAIRTVAEGAEILMGIKGGTMEWQAEKGVMIFEPSSLFDRVNKRLEVMADLFNPEAEEEENNNKEVNGNGEKTPPSSDKT